MGLQRLANLHSVRKQHLLVEFSSLKHACPHGVFMSLTPGDPTLWSGVLFVRKGPYSPSILRFHVSFPPSYPNLPPLVTFSTDIFHPLITPLTTYMYTTDSNNSGTVSATDEERLPPGGFSLRHGFPDWFGRASRRSADRERQRIGVNTLQTPPRGGTSSPGLKLSPTAVAGTNESGSTVESGSEGREKVTTYDVLRYIRSVFDDEDVLDSVPLEAAGNPGAWHAWRTHRVKIGKINSPTNAIHQILNQPESLDGSPSDVAAKSSIPEVKQRVASAGSNAPMIARRPGEWNWDGVWEVRVKKGIEASMGESALFGKDAGDDMIRFLNMEDGDVEGIRENMVRSLESAEELRRGG